MGTDKRSKLLSFFKPFSRPLPTTQDPPNAPHDLEPSAPIPLGPHDIPLPQLVLDRGPSTALSLYTAISGLPSDVEHAGLVTRYPSFQSNTHSSPQTPARLPSHLSLSTMGFGNSPFRIFACDTPEPLPIARPVSDFGQIDRAKLEEADRLILSPSVDDENTSALSGGMPSLASAIQIRETGTGSCRNTTNPDPLPAPRASTWRALPRSLSRNSLFESWSHGRGQKGSVAGQDLQQACGNQPIDAKPDTFRVKRKMSVDNIVHSISRRSRLFRVKHEESGPIQDSESRRWTAVYSEASDDSLAPNARTAAIDTQSKGNRMALPPMRSFRNKFTLTKRDSRRASILDIGSGRNGSPIRLSAMFQHLGDTHPAQRSVQSSSAPLELSDVQDTVEINRSPNPAQVPTPQQPATTVGRRQSAAAAAASALQLALSPARDDISILDPSRTPMVMPLSVSMKSLHLIKSNTSVPRVAGDLDERLQRTELPHTMDQNLLKSANRISSDGSSLDMPTKTGNIALPASDSRNVLLSTMSSLRTMSELASTDSSESLAARMRQSLSELKSAFKRMRNMSQLDLSSDGSRRTSGNDDPAILPTTENRAPVEDTTNGEDVDRARSRREQGHVAGEQSVSSTKMTTFVSASESFTGTDGRMSCAPSGTSWHTAKEDLQISYGSLTGLSWMGS